MPLPSLKWRASPNFNARGGARVDLIVIHDMEGSYEGSIDWFAQRQSDVSAHFCIRDDGGEITQMVHLSDRAWHACAFNSRSIGIEMAGFASRGYTSDLVQATAALAAELCHFLQIPVRHARGGVGAGLESHWGLGRPGGGHSDPSTDPAFMERFIALVQAEYDRGFDPHCFDLDGEKPCALKPPGRAESPVSVASSTTPLESADPNDTEGLQRALNLLGVTTPALQVDGVMGARSKQAVRLFQNSAGLTADGVVGPQTMSALRKELAHA